MNILFGNGWVEHVCKTKKAAVKLLGEQGYRRLRRRLELIDKVPTFRDLRGQPGRLHPLTRDWKGHHSLDLTGKLRLIFRKVPTSEVVERLGLAAPPSHDTIEVAHIGDTHE